jgi:hypothetical protein
MTRLAVAAPIAIVVLVAGCAHPGPRVSDATRKALPTQQYALSEEVCPDDLGMPRALEERTRRRGRRRLRALIVAHRRDPDAVVRTSWSSSDESPGVHHEDMTIDELLGTHLSTAEELADGEDASSACFARVAAQLRAARD